MVQSVIISPTIFFSLATHGFWMLLLCIFHVYFNPEINKRNEFIAFFFIVVCFSLFSGDNKCLSFNGHCIWNGWIRPSDPRICWNANKFGASQTIKKIVYSSQHEPDIMSLCSMKFFKISSSTQTQFVNHVQGVILRIYFLLLLLSSRNSTRFFWPYIQFSHS